MTVEETVKTSMLTYPSLYKDRFDVYRHLFISYGTGYEWVNGELVCTLDYEREYCKTIEEAVKKAFDTHMSDKQMLDSSLKFIKEYTLNAILNVVNWEENSKKFIPKASMYEIDRYISLEYSPIFTVPSDVKEDWKEAALVMLNWLINDSEVKNDKILQKAHQVQNQLSCTSQ